MDEFIKSFDLQNGESIIISKNNDIVTITIKDDTRKVSKPSIIYKAKAVEMLSGVPYYQMHGIWWYCSQQLDIPVFNERFDSIKEVDSFEFQMLINKK